MNVTKVAAQVENQRVLEVELSPMGRETALDIPSVSSRHIMAFQLRYIENLTYRRIGEIIGRLDGTGPLSSSIVQQMAFKVCRRLYHSRMKNHPWKKLVAESKPYKRGQKG